MKEEELSQRLKDKLWTVGEELEEIREGLRERKTERLQLRVTPTEKAELERMTGLLGVSAADYLMHLHRRAVKQLERRNSRHSGLRTEGDRGDPSNTEARKQLRKRRGPHKNDSDGEPGGAMAKI